MDIEVLKSYLVDLGFAVNQPQLRKFDGALKEAASAVGFRTAGIIKDVFKLQTALTGAFVSVSSGIVAMADHAAAADQKYRLLGLRMFMTQESARKLQIGLGALGASLEEVAWDPELNARFLKLADDQDRMAKGLGKNFAQTMRSIRDLRFEFTRLQVAVKYLSMQFVETLFARLGLTVGGVQEKLEHFVRWFQDKIPDIANQLADVALPVLKDTWHIVLELGEALAETAVMFTNLVGLFSGDHSIEGTEFSFHNLAEAVKHVVGWVNALLHALTNTEQLLVRFTSACALVLSGRFAEAKMELAGALDVLRPSTGAMGGAATGALIGSVIPGVGTGIGAAGGMIVGALLGGTKQAIAPTPNPDTTSNMKLPGMAGLDQPSGNDIASGARQVALKAGAELGLDPKLLFEQFQHETGGFTNRGATQLNNLAGIREAGGLAYRKFDSLDDFERYYVNLLRGKRYTSQGILNAKTEEDFASALKRGGYYEDSYRHYVNGMKRFAQEDAARSAAAAPVQSNITVGEVQVHITQPGASAEDVHRAATKGVTDALRQQTTRNLAQLSFVGG